MLFNALNFRLCSLGLQDTGIGKGKGYSCNFPLRHGITDEVYKNVFEPVKLSLYFQQATKPTFLRIQVITEVMRTYNPSAIVLQCGTDSLSGDKLGSLNLSMRGTS